MTQAEQGAVSNWNVPNALTTLRILMVPFFGWALLYDGGHDVTWRWVAWALFVLAIWLAVQLIFHRITVGPQFWQFVYADSWLFQLMTAGLAYGAALGITLASLAWARELTGKRHYFEFKWDEATGVAQVKQRDSTGDPTPWTCECGSKVVKGDAPLLLRNEDRGKQVDVERRSVVLKGKWQERDLELHAVEKVFRLQTGFRLRQELPDFW